MTRYIDADELRLRVKEKTNPYGKPTLDYESGVKVLNMIDNTPSADVVPKSEVESFNKSKGGFCPLCGSYTITQEMMEKLRMAHKEQGQHSDPIGEDGAEGEDGQEDLNPLYRMSKADVAREIFEEIESKKMFLKDCVGNMGVVVLFKDISELKKKYTEEKK